MKSKLLVAFVLITSAAFAQVDLVGYGGYQFGSKTYYYPSYLRVKSNADYGVNLEVGIRPDFRLQFSWMGTATQMRLEGYNNIAAKVADCNVNYYQIGAISPFPTSSIVEGFGSFSLGATQYNLQDYTYNDEWRFSITLGLGANIWISDHVGLRVHARLLAPINWAGLGFYCGTGGCGTSANAGSTMISGDVGGGLVIRLKQ